MYDPEFWLLGEDGFPVLFLGIDLHEDPHPEHAVPYDGFMMPTTPFQVDEVFALIKEKEV